ncbi:hypothetical protein HAX54_018046 [Datura stramonium]|uniref:RING-type domain-containing protein n=1 Tax=Datura stramonium TaxID=4076 RepID=A0ABS8S1P0_DATST|nr:hypothetical protein [Datura stramonium]
MFTEEELRDLHVSREDDYARFRWPHLPSITTISGGKLRAFTSGALEINRECLPGRREGDIIISLIAPPSSPIPGWKGSSGVLPPISERNILVVYKHMTEIREEEEDEFENDLYEWILDEEIMAEAEEFENDLSEWILDEEIMVEEEEFENDDSQCKRHNQLEEEAEEEDDNANEVLDQDMSEYLKTRTFCAMDTDNFNEVEEQEACAICLFDYQDEDTIGTLQCGHEFHAECINKWLQRNTSCPFCRAPVLPQ